MTDTTDYKTLYLATQLDADQLRKDKSDLEHKVLQLQYQVQQLAKFLKGFKTETFIPSSSVHPSQKELGLVFDGAATVQTETLEEITYTRKKQSIVIDTPRQNDTQIPEHIRREIKVLEPAEDVSGCERLEDEITETLCWKPGEIFARRTVRPKYRKVDERGKEKIIVASLPERAVAKCKADPELLAQIVVDKFVDHKPLNRQLECFKRSNVQIAYSTIGDWVKEVANVIEPFRPVLLQQMLQYNYWHADETGIAVLDKNKKRDTHQGYFWTYMTGDGRLIFYDYQRGREGKYPLEILKLFKGHLQTDGYSVYEDLGLTDIIVFFCMAHARRKIYDARGNDKARAEHALTEIKKLYDIEEECRRLNLNHEQVQEKRQLEALPILNALGAWMTNQYEQLRPKTQIAQAFAYSIKRWEKLCLYTTTGHLHIDNNQIERCMKNIAVGRKNYMFCGSHEAAKRAGLLYSLLVSCKLNDVNPYEWLKDILSRNIKEMHINKLKDLLPHNWKKSPAALSEENTTA